MQIRLKTFLSAAATIALLGSVPAPLLAQQAGTGQLSEIVDDDVMVAAFDLSVDQIDDMKVIVDGEIAGEIEEVLKDGSGAPAAVAVEFEDDFIDRGDDERVVPLERLRLDGDRFVTDLTRDEIGNLPEWDD